MLAIYCADGVHEVVWSLAGARRAGGGDRAPTSSSPRPMRAMVGTPTSPQSKPQAMRLSSKRAMMAVATAQSMRATQSPSREHPPPPSSPTLLLISVCERAHAVTRS